MDLDAAYYTAENMIRNGTNTAWGNNIISNHKEKYRI